MLVSLGLIVASAGFGVMLMSFIKSSRQTGPVLGGVMTLTGYAGRPVHHRLSPIFRRALISVTLLTPQGWALQGWKLALSGAGVGQTLVPVVVMLVMGLPSSPWVSSFSAGALPDDSGGGPGRASPSLKPSLTTGRYMWCYVAPR